MGYLMFWLVFGRDSPEPGRILPITGLSLTDSFSALLSMLDLVVGLGGTRGQPRDQPDGLVHGTPSLVLDSSRDSASLPLSPLHVRLVSSLLPLPSSLQKREDRSSLLSRFIQTFHLSASASPAVSPGTIRKLLGGPDFLRLQYVWWKYVWWRGSAWPRLQLKL